MINGELLNNISKHENSVENISVNSGSTKNITECSITAPKKGIALVVVNANFEQNSNGYRMLNISRNGSASYPSVTVRVPSVSNAATTLTTVKAINLNTNDIICPRCQQNSGETLVCNFNIQVIYLS